MEVIGISCINTFRNTPINGFLDDYSFLIRGLLDLYEASYEPYWIEWSDILQETQNKLFWDETDGAYYNSPTGDGSVKVRMKEGS